MGAAHHPIQLIAGLGNPGPSYAHTRHNAGAWAVELLASSYQVDLHFETKFNGQVGRMRINDRECWLLIPSTYMNLSGLCVHALASFYKIPSQAILIAHDELDFSPGIIRIKQDGGHGGHNGLRDVINHFHSNQFYRLRIGIGHPGHRDHVHDYVLSRPPKREFEQILDAITRMLTFVPDLISGNIEKVVKSLHTDA